MNKNEITQLIGKFGLIRTSGEFAKSIYGTIRETDILYNIWFVDNDDIGYLFKLKDVISFEEKELKKTLI
jgi:hypothetical protein